MKGAFFYAFFSVTHPTLYLIDKNKKQRIEILEQFPHAHFGSLTYHLYSVETYPESLGNILALHLVYICHTEHLPVARRQRVDGITHHTYDLRPDYSHVTLICRRDLHLLNIPESHCATAVELVQMVDTLVAHSSIDILPEMQL